MAARKTLHQRILDLGFEIEDICEADSAGTAYSKHRFGPTPGDRRQVMIIPAIVAPEAFASEMHLDEDLKEDYSIIYENLRNSQEKIFGRKTFHQRILDLDFRFGQICDADLGGTMYSKYRLDATSKDKKQVMVVPAMVVPETFANEGSLNKDKIARFSVIYVER